jgi:hypothetical protein
MDFSCFEPRTDPAPAACAPRFPFLRDGIEIPIHDLPLQTAARGVEVRDCELEALLPSGRRVFLWGHASPLRDAAGRVRGAIAALQDVPKPGAAPKHFYAKAKGVFRKRRMLLP